LPIVVKRTPRFHRWLGRFTATLVLLALVPSGLYLSLFAKGGLPTTLGFALSGAIVGVAMVQAVRAARARRIVDHRRWALHVLAQLSVAVTSRALLYAFDAAAVDETLAYLVSLWLPVVGSFAVVELVSRRGRPFLATWRPTMKSSSPLIMLAFGALFLSPPAPAEELPAAPDAQIARALVERELVKPLAAKERDQSRFSRARLPAQERRVRVREEGTQKDAAGRSFFTFAVDARHGILAANDESAWRLETITGCVYVESGDIFVKSGDGYRPAAFLLGKNLKPAAEPTCHAASEVAIVH
jgi:hypothetical protein